MAKKEDFNEEGLDPESSDYEEEIDDTLGFKPKSSDDADDTADEDKEKEDDGDKKEKDTEEGVKSKEKPNEDSDKDEEKDEEEDEDEKGKEGAEGTGEEEGEEDEEGALAEKYEQLLEEFNNQFEDTSELDTGEEDDEGKDEDEDEGEKSKDERKSRLDEILTDEALEEAMTDPASLRKMLTSVHDVAKQESIKEALRTLPESVDREVERRSKIQEMNREFFDDNPELVPLNKYVGHTVNMLSGEHPDWSYKKLLKEAGGLVRKKIDLSHLVQRKRDEVRNKGTRSSESPRKPNARRSRQKGGEKKKRLTEEEKDIMETLEVGEKEK